MIEVFKLLAGVENIDCNQFFMPATTCYALTGHDRMLVKTRHQEVLQSACGQLLEQFASLCCPSNICEYVQELI